MGNFLKTKGIDLALYSMALTALTTGPAWATLAAPGPAAGVLVGGAIIGALVIAKVWRRK